MNRARGLPARQKVTWPTPGSQGIRRVPLDDYATNLARILGEAHDHHCGVIVLALADEGMIGPRQSAGSAEPYVSVQRATALAAHVPLVQARDAWSGRASGEVLRDGLHPNALGAQLLAQAVADAVMDAGGPATVPVPGKIEPLATPADPADGSTPAGPHSLVRESLESDR